MAAPGVYPCQEMVYRDQRPILLDRKGRYQMMINILLDRLNTTCKTMYSFNIILEVLNLILQNKDLCSSDAALHAWSYVAVEILHNNTSVLWPQYVELIDFQSYKEALKQVKGHEPIISYVLSLLNVAIYEENSELKKSYINEVFNMIGCQ